MPIELPPGTAAYSDNNPPVKNRQLLVLLGLVVALLVIGFSLLSNLVNSLVNVIPLSVEQQLGALIVPVYEKQAENSAVQTTLNQLLDRLETHLPTSDSPGTKRNYQVLYIPDKTVNAMAIPGDRVIIYGGLLDQMQSENELMMVMGHELGHFAHRDHLRGLGRNLLWRLAIAAFFGSDPGTIQAIASSGLVSIGNAQFSQSQEREADSFGLELLQATYGQVAGATDFFARLSQKERVDLAFLNTHPNPKARVVELQRQIKAKRYPVGVRSPLPASLHNLDSALMQTEQR